MTPSASAVELVHATALALDGKAVLIRGPSGAGKSDLALRCIAAGPVIGLPRVELLSDDQVWLTRNGRGIIAVPPPAIAGKIEVRGLGIVEVPYCSAASVALAIDLVPPDLVPRMPLEKLTTELLGAAVPLLRLAPFEASAPLKVILALARSPEALTPP
ncbi:MAG: HPr kinase/phosphatase C-terminal domain-containing protein [Hyphomicrobium sp.]|jgi:serine kinase of HPr protein (carbohydrate metabolism regulator)|uniref:HPr kinase/phosphorylase n=1 Tax=Hyphomicrobium sp. TaxID=82 RepID=UPI0025C20775|nr:HPr kinase/phosphatase C-terminal domain-containing protein [Hyphomicrobium sp.]MBX9863360.1 HPr kinase/phosphatase C-terminal domain-containing protein [Hyphomicrobium sp.]